MGVIFGMDRKWMKHDCSANTQETKALLLGREWTKRRKFNEVLLEDYAQRGQFFSWSYAGTSGTLCLCSSESRLGIKVLDSAGEWHNACLVPFADGFNTAEQVNVACFTNAASSHFICQRHVMLPREMSFSYHTNLNQRLYSLWIMDFPWPIKMAALRMSHSDL